MKLVELLAPAKDYAAAAAAVEAHGVLRNAVNAEADRSLGKPRFEGGDNPLAPFGFIRQPIAIITFGIYPKYFELPDKTASRFEQRLRWPRRGEAQG
mgnify:CR=1 FL=1